MMSAEKEQQALNTTAQDARVIVTSLPVPGCCGSVNAKTGAKIFAIINIVLAMFTLGISIALSCKNYNSFILYICAVIGFGLNILVLEGVRKEKSIFFIPSMVVCVVSIACYFVYIYLAVFIAATSVRKSDVEFLLASAYGSAVAEYVCDTVPMIAALITMFFYSVIALIYNCWQIKVYYDCFNYMKYKEQSHASNTVHTQTFGNNVYRTVI